MQFRPFKVMQKKIADDQVPAARRLPGAGRSRARRPVVYVANHHFDAPPGVGVAFQRCVADQLLAIKQRELDWRRMFAQRPRHAQHQAAIACAKFKNAQRLAVRMRCRQLSERAQHNAARSHHAVYALQITARTHCGGVGLGQTVECFDADPPGQRHACLARVMVPPPATRHGN